MLDHLFTSDYIYFSFAGYFSSKVICDFAEKMLA